jgi:MYXO-CTERM domain-containing protein
MLSQRLLALGVAVALLSTSSMAVFAQDAATPAAPVTMEADDNDDDGFNLGWLGLLGLAGLLSLRKRTTTTCAQPIPAARHPATKIW